MEIVIRSLADVPETWRICVDTNPAGSFQRSYAI